MGSEYATVVSRRTASRPVLSSGLPTRAVSGIPYNRFHSSYAQRTRIGIDTSSGANFPCAAAALQKSSSKASHGVSVQVTDSPSPETQNESHKWVVQDEPVSGNPASGQLLQSTITQSASFESLQNLLDEALLRSPRAAAIRANLGIARSQYAYQVAQPNPFFFFDRGILAEAVRRIGPAFNWVSPWQIAFGLLLARDQVNQARLDILRDLWSLRADVQRAYSDVVIAQETEKATEALLNLAEMTEHVTSKRFQAGAVPEFDVIRARLAKEQAQLDLHQAQRRVIKAKQHLDLIIGRPIKRPIPIAPLSALDKPDALGPVKDDFIPNLSRDVPDVSLFIEQARKYRWDLKDMQQQMQVNKAALKDAFANIMPMPQFYFGQSVSGNQPGGPKLRPPTSR